MRIEADTAASKLLPVMELFGPVIQGEGTLAGSQTFFVRLGGCDYRCSWCDSLHAVLPEQVKSGRTMMKPLDIIESLVTKYEHLTDYWLTLSGGNPAMHDCTQLCISAHRFGMKIAIETQGTILPSWIDQCDQITISPKPPSSGNCTIIDKEWADKWLKCGKWGSKMCIKIVIFNPGDYDYALNAIRFLERNYETHEIDFYLQPGTTQGITDVIDDILCRTRTVINNVVTEPDLRRVKVLPQVHALLYRYEKGK